MIQFSASGAVIGCKAHGFPGEGDRDLHKLPMEDCL